MKVSIITVCFNSVTTIEQTIRSVINQTYSNIEYIIIDGGSTDGTLDIIQKYKSQITYFASEPDDGLYDAMNKGIYKANGEIVGIINSDDWYELSTVGKVVHCFETTDADFVHGDMREIVEECNLSYIRKPSLGENSIYYRLASFHPTVFVNKEMYIRYGKFDCRYEIGADVDLMLRFHDQGVKFYYLEDVLTNYRVDGISGRRSWKALREGFQIYLQALRITEKVNIDEFTNKVKKNFYKGRIYNLDTFIDRRLAREEQSKVKEKFFQQILKGKDELILFGTGFRGVYFYKWCFSQKMKVVLCVDNSISRQQEMMGNLDIEAPAVLTLKKQKAIIVIAADDAKYAMERQLMDMGFVYRKDYLFYMDIINALRWLYVKEHDWLLPCLQEQMREC